MEDTSVVPGLLTLESIQRRLGVRRGRLKNLLTQVGLAQVSALTLGQGRGSFRLLPFLTVALLRQLTARSPHRIDEWQGAVHDVITSTAWREALEAISNRWPSTAGAGHQGIQILLGSPSLVAEMAALQQETRDAVERHGLQEDLQIESLIIDRLEDEDDAVVLVGRQARAYLLPKALLTIAGLTWEKAQGIIQATRTGGGIEIDIWPRAGEAGQAAWQPDPDLLALVTDTGVPRTVVGSHIRADYASPLTPAASILDKAEWQLREGEIDSAEAALHGVLATADAPSRARAAYSIAQIAEDRGDLEQARSYYQQALATDDPLVTPIAAFNLAVLEVDNRPQAAVAAYERVISSGHPDLAAKAAMNLAVLYEQQGDLERAQDAYRRVLAYEHPDATPKAAFMLAKLLQAGGDFTAAADVLREALRFNHPDVGPQASFLLGVVAAQRGDVADAIAIYQEIAGSAHPIAARANLNLGVLLMQQGDTSDAIAAYRRALASADELVAPRAALNLAALLYAQGDTEGAEGAYRTALQGPPELAAHARLNVGVLLHREGRVEEAEASFVAAASSEQAAIVQRALANLLVLLQQQGRHEEVRLLFDRLLETADADVRATVLANQAAQLFLKGEQVEAEALARQAIATEHPDAAPRSAYHLGVMLEERGAYEEAMTMYRQVLASDHARLHLDAAFRLALLLEEAGNLHEAAAAYEQVLDAAHRVSRRVLHPPLQTRAEAGSATDAMVAQLVAIAAERLKHMQTQGMSSTAATRDPFLRRLLDARAVASALQEPPLVSDLDASDLPTLWAA